MQIIACAGSGKTEVVAQWVADLLADGVDAGRREGLDVRAAYVHDLKYAACGAVDVTPAAIVAAEAEVESAVPGLRRREFRARPGRPCRRCDLKKLCRWEAA